MTSYFKNYSYTTATPLGLTAHHGHNLIVHQLVFYGANMEAKNNNGGTALMLAVERGNYDVVTVLKMHGADEACINVSCPALETNTQFICFPTITRVAS